MNDLFISEYNSEEMLRSDLAFSLPEVNIFSGKNHLLLRGMDGLTLTMLEDGDSIITTEKLPADYLNYWCDNICNVQNLSPVDSSETKNSLHNSLETKVDSYDTEESRVSLHNYTIRKSIYTKITEDVSLHKTLRDNHIVNYALVPGYYEMCQTLKIDYNEPSLDLIKELNSKMYSNELKTRLDLPAKAVAIHSVNEYEEKIDSLLREKGRVLIKDAMGVSGKGMLLIDNDRIAQRLTTHFRKQQEMGRKDFSFLLEPVLSKKMDFSSLLNIESNGKIKIQGYQKNVSRGYSYQGTVPLTQSELEYIMSTGYLEVILNIANDMKGKGYKGYFCIDSMITEEGQVIPLLEINPRMSISRFNMKISEKVSRSCHLSFFEGKRADDISITKVLSDLNELEILYTKERGKGVIPLAPCTWDNGDGAGKRVRVYYIIVYETQDDYEKISNSWFPYSSGSICTGNIT